MSHRLRRVISPMTGEVIGLMLIPNHTLKKAMDEYNDTRAAARAGAWARAAAATSGASPRQGAARAEWAAAQGVIEYDINDMTMYMNEYEKNSIINNIKNQVNIPNEMNRMSLTNT